MTTAAEDRLLVLLRHAEAVDLRGAGDLERELTDAGVRDAEAAGQWLHEHGVGIDEVLCSSSTRTQQTAEGVWSGGCAEADVHVDRRLYNASPEAILDVVRDADEDANVVMVIAHAPGLPALASLLADGQGSIAAHEAMGNGFPTTGLALLRFSGRWRDLDFGDAVLDRFHIARG
ncbi:MAG TPA: histidine phosphatase family protein [Phycicoccus sp.]|nr:histidine phosphatase family protein [Phycicoccus sp.]